MQLTLSDAVEDKGIHVTANDEVTVYGLNRKLASTDAYLGLPTDVLGTEYIILTYETTLASYGVQFAVVGIESSTTVTITPSATTDGHTAGVPYTITLNQGQTYMLQNNTMGADLSGSIVTADKPIAVFGSNQCTQIPTGIAACDHIIEQLPPVPTWGQNFVTFPLATRLNGDRFRFLASADAASVSVNGSVVATLNRGQFHEQVISGTATITATAPVLVAQYSHSTNYDGVTSDPFMMLIPPYEQFMGEYTLSTPASGFSGNYINIVAPNAAVGSISVDGTAIPAGDYTAIGNGFSGVAYSVTLGSHRVTGTLPFGAFSYGFDSADSYGYPGGASYVPLSSINSVTLTLDSPVPPVGQQLCMTALVEDQLGAPMEGVRADFAVSGANTASGFDFTDVNGEATFCYTGSSSGDDTIIASAGAKSDTKYASWSSNPVLTVSKDGSGSGTVSSNPAGINCGATCQASFTATTVVTLTATPVSTSTFFRWTGACSGAGVCQVTMTETKQITATILDNNADDDSDGIPNIIEITYGTDPLDPTDPWGDDAGETTDPDDDDDGDGVSNAWERILGTDPNDADSDSTKTTPDENDNGIDDGDEDFDGDGIPNAIEIANGTDPLDPTDPWGDDAGETTDPDDDDGDGVSNAWERILGTDPNDADSDSTKTTPDENDNGIDDGDEDFDGDGVSNEQEIADGTDPLDPSDFVSHGFKIYLPLVIRNG